MLIWHMCPPEVGESSFSEHRALYLMLTLLLGKMLDVASYGQYGGKLCLV
jgi:hypothetical protein